MHGTSDVPSEQKKRRPVRRSVMLPGFHPGERGSTPLRATRWSGVVTAAWRSDTSPEAGATPPRTTSGLVGLLGCVVRVASLVVTQEVGVRVPAPQLMCPWPRGRGGSLPNCIRWVRFPQGTLPHSGEKKGFRPRRGVWSPRHSVTVETTGSNPVRGARNGTVRKPAKRPSSNLGDRLWVRLPPVLLRETRPVRLAAKDTGPSSQEDGFDSHTGYSAGGQVLSRPS
jgi:hypothetical protein